MTVAIVPGLSKSQHRRAARIGPRAVASNKTPHELLTGAGFVDVESRDVTEECLSTAKAWHREYVENDDELRNLIGDELDDLYKNRVDLIAGVEEGLLQRTLAYGRKAS